MTLIQFLFPVIGFAITSCLLALMFAFLKFKDSYFYDRLTHYGVFETLFVDIIRPIQFFWQRMTRGFDDSCTWSLDCHLAELILPRLKLFRKQEFRGAPH